MGSVRSGTGGGTSREEFSDRSVDCRFNNAESELQAIVVVVAVDGGSGA